MAPQVDPEQRTAAVTRLRQLRTAGQSTSRHVRLAADGLGVAERTVWRRLGSGAAGEQGRRRGRAPYRLSEIDREALAFFHGSVAAVHRARAGDELAARRTAADLCAESGRKHIDERIVANTYALLGGTQ
ncbi:transposase [Planomonospora sphaerica]|uniref:Transposase n=1 Tax=Planomonospora sphaerica TaxID=161355 RepID=A0A171DLP6_9ACTN|nr:hypothetical protein [Planomonospora sphaerica]GAT69820.1 transposase [Planomonospora sphaerica]